MFRSLRDLNGGDGLNGFQELGVNILQNLESGSDSHMSEDDVDNFEDRKCETMDEVIADV